MAKTSKNARRTHHSGTLQLRGRKWLAIWQVNGKRFAQSTGLEDRAEAEAWLAHKLRTVSMIDGLKRLGNEKATLDKMRQTFDEALGDLDHQRQALLDSAALKFCDLWATYQTSPRRRPVAPATLTKAGQHLRHFAKWLAEKHPEITLVKEISEDIAAEYAAEIRGEYRATSYTTILTTLHGIWQTLRREIKGGANPWAADNLPRDKPGAPIKGAFTDEELAVIFDRAAQTRPPLHRLFKLMLFTGLRLSDAAQLTWASIDLERNCVKLMPQKTRRFQKYVEIPLLPPLREMLAAVPTADRTGELFPELADAYRRGHLASHIAKWMRQECGIQRGAFGVGAHCFRHTFISKAAKAGVPFAIVQALVGHTTARQSAHYFHEDLESSAHALAAFPSLPAAGGVIGHAAPTDALKDFQRVFLRLSESDRQRAAAWVASQVSAEPVC